MLKILADQDKKVSVFYHTVTTLSSKFYHSFYVSLFSNVSLTGLTSQDNQTMRGTRAFRNKLIITSDAETTEWHMTLEGITCEHVILR